MTAIRVIVRSFLIPLLLCGLGWCGPAAGTECPPDSLKTPHNSLVALPYAYYTPETKFAFGGGVVFSFRPSSAPPGERPSNIKMALAYTQLRQFLLVAKPEVYLDHERFLLMGSYGFYLYPDKFWGIGGNTPDEAGEDYQSKNFESYSNIQMRVLPGLYVGVRHEFSVLNVEDAKAGGSLASGLVLGSDGGAASGLGFIVNYDTRNHVYQPSSGFYNQCFAMFFGNALGSDFTFNVLSVDLRYYRRAFRSHTIAFQTYDTFTSGEPPFQMMSLIGGSYTMRGYYYGRYRDRHMLTAQAEYRFPIWWRFGGVAFAGAGDVSSTVEGFRLDRVKYGFGCGARFMFDARERINARLDLGIARDWNVGVYAMVLEAF